MKLRDEHWSILLCTVVALAMLSPITSSAAYDPKADGKDFAKTVLVPKGEGISKDEAAPKEVPLFTDTPPGTSYADDPVAMEADAVVAKGSNEGYNAMIDSMGKRATFSKSDLEATTKFGNEVIADPGATLEPPSAVRPALAPRSPSPSPARASTSRPAIPATPRPAAARSHAPSLPRSSSRRSSVTSAAYLIPVSTGPTIVR
jgi:hypothetical protein